MGISNPFIPRLSPPELQRRLQRTVKPLPALSTLNVDKFGHVRLYCTRNFEQGCLVLRVRVQGRPNDRGVVRDYYPVLLLVTEIVKQDVFCPILDSLVDMVRLQNPDYKFVVTKKYAGQKAV